jgi:hypothetical protein
MAQKPMAMTLGKCDIVIDAARASSRWPRQSENFVFSSLAGAHP